MSTISIGTTTTNGYIVESDTTGALVIKTGSTPTTAVTVSSAQAVSLANTLDVTGATTLSNTLAVTGVASLNGGVQASGVTTNIYPIVRSTPQTVSGVTAVNFTGIPSWARRITFSYYNVVTSAVVSPAVQIGAGSLTTTGYLGYAGQEQGPNSASLSLSNGFPIAGGVATTYTTHGNMFLVNHNGNVWVASMAGGSFNSANSGGIGQNGGGLVTISGTLDRLSIIVPSGTFSGTFNVMWE